MSLEENRLRKIVTDGEFFKTIFDEPIFQEKVKELEMSYFRQFQTADKDACIDTWLESQALLKLLSTLREPILLAQQAQESLNRIDEMNDH